MAGRINTERVCAIAAAIAVLVGGMGLTGWVLTIPWMTGISPAWTTMKANTALCFVLYGTSLYLQRSDHAPRRQLNVGRALAAIVVLVGVLTLAEYAFAVDLGIDQALLRQAPDTVGTSLPGRMALGTAICFLLLGAALLGVAAETDRARQMKSAFAIAVGLLAFIAVAGYSFEAKDLYAVPAYGSMAFHTAAAFFVLAVGVLYARPGTGSLTMLTAEGPGGSLARRVLPVALLLPLAFGALRRYGEVTGLYPAGFGYAIATTASAIAFAVFTWTAAVSLDRASKSRQALMESERIRLYFKRSSDWLSVFDPTGRAIEVSDSLCEMLGYSRAELLGMHRLQWDDTLQHGSVLSPIAQRPAGTQEEFGTTCRRKDGTTIEVDVHAETFDVQGEKFLFCSARDAQEHRRLQRAVLDGVYQQQRKTAYDLHEGLAQDLTGMSMLLATLAAADGKDGRQDTEHLAELERLVKRSIHSCRIMAEGLSPLTFAGGDLVAALQHLVADYRDAFHIECRFAKTGTAPLLLDVNASEQLYRIAQEAIANACRHADAQLVSVTLDLRPNMVCLEVSDDGKGMNESPDEVAGMGLKIMRYRAGTIGANMAFLPRSGGGTVVLCECPQPTSALLGRAQSA